MLRREQMLATLMVVAALNMLGRAGTAGAAQQRPNVVLILADDLGYSELGCYGNTFNETPHLDELATRGVRFTDAYAAAPVCSPTRVSLLTGLWPARVGINDYLRPDDSKNLAPEYVTLAELFRQAGYATGLIGKWHLSGYESAGARQVRPTDQGFDEALVTEEAGIAGGSYFHPYHFNRSIAPRLGPREYLVDRLNREAVEFIERHRDGPFFLYLSHYAVHTRLVGRPDLVAKYRAKPGAGDSPEAPRRNVHLAAQLEAIDEGVGQVLQTLDRLGLADETIVVFLSDNGGEDRVTTNAPLRGGKSTLYEGGVRVPWIVRWPGHVPAGTTCAEPISTVDLLPTAAAILGVAPPGDPPPDGVSLLPLLADPPEPLDRAALYWHYPLRRPHFLGGVSAGAIRAGRWKLIEFFTGDRVELYDLAADPGEQTDLAAARPDLARQLLARLAAWRAEVGAEVHGH